MTDDTTRLCVLPGVAADAITATIIPFPAAALLAQEQAQREEAKFLRVFRALPKRYRLPFVRMLQRMANGMPTAMAQALCDVECKVADLAAGFVNPGAAS